MPVKSSGITPEKVYKRRRMLIAVGLGVLAIPLLDKGYGLMQQRQEVSQPLILAPTSNEDERRPF